MYRLYAARFGKSRWGDKTPIYYSHMAVIQRVLPEARFIHVVRDGRDVALSHAGLWFGPGAHEDAALWWVSRVQDARRQADLVPAYLEVRYEDLITDTESTLRRICQFLRLPWQTCMLDYYRRAGERLAELNRDVPAPDGSRIVRGEDRLGIFERTTHPPDAERVARWRRELPADQLATFEHTAGSMLREFGYMVGGRSSGAPIPCT
jgi:hypothetical protein